MPLTPVAVEAFGGLRLDRAPEDVGAEAAVSLSNVDVDIPGKLRVRPGLAYFDAGDASTFGADPIRRTVEVNRTAGNWQVAANGTTIGRYLSGVVDAYTPSVPLYGMIDLLPVDPFTVAVTDETGLRAVGSGGLMAVVTSTPRGGYMAISRRDQRLVIAGSSVASATRSTRVNFGPANAFLGSSWTEWVDLPSDQAITGVAALGDLVIVFQETRATVFYSSSVSATGSPIFHYRTVDLGDRIAYTNPVGNPPGRFGSDGNAAYFAARMGVYEFNGSSAPTLISAAVSDEWLQGGWVFDQTVKVCATADRVYVHGNVARGVTLVFDKRTREWTSYGFASSAMAAPPLVGPRVMRVAGTRLSTLSPGFPTDHGAPIAWHYQSGKYPVSERGRVAVTQTSSVTGVGTVNLRVGTDKSPGVTQVPLSGAVTEAEGFADGLDQEGRWYQHRLSGVGEFEVSRLTHYVQSVKAGGIG